MFELSAQRSASPAAAGLPRLLLDYRATSGKRAAVASGAAAVRLEPLLGAF